MLNEVEDAPDDSGIAKNAPVPERVDGDQFRAADEPRGGRAFFPRHFAIVPVVNDERGDIDSRSEGLDVEALPRKAERFLELTDDAIAQCVREVEPVEKEIEVAARM